MIEISEAVASSLARGNRRQYVRAESWYDDQLLDEGVPVSGGRLDVDRGSGVPERVTLTVPRRTRGVDYTPRTVTSPLAANGQQLRVSIGIGTTFGQVEWIQLGWFVITSAVPRGAAIEVEAAGLLWLIQEARLINPLQPSGTFKSTIQNLIEPAITVNFDAALTDRAVPASVNYDDDRLGALEATLAAWPAVADMTPAGDLYVTTADDPATVSLALTDGQGGTIITADGESTRDDAYNAVVAQGTASDGGLVRGVAYDTTGPKRSGGPFNPLPVPLFFDSPLITTQAQANAAAATRLQTLKRSTSINYDIEMVPHPALQTGDRITLTTDELDAAPAIIEAFSLPLTPGGGTQRLSVRLI